MIAHGNQEHMMLDQSVPDHSLMTIAGPSAEKHCPIRVVSDERRQGPVAPPTICITGQLTDIDYKYHVDSSRVLGSGHQGSVRECVNRFTGERFAVKSVRKADPEVKPAGLAREILLLREMKHENIVRLVDVFEDAECIHLVTDLCQGGELFDKIVERWAKDDGNACFAENEASRIMRQVLEAISYMHKRDVVHRDIKPENILFTSSSNDGDSSVKIIDFGLSRKHRAGLEPAMTTLVGTPYYIAPEVLRKRYDRSCDMWSVGVIAYILLCGYPPFNGADNDQTHRRVMRGKYSFPAKDWDIMSGEAVDFIQRLLQMDPRRRMTAEEALRHPWILRHRQASSTINRASAAISPSDVVISISDEEERQDRASVEVFPIDAPRMSLPAHRLHGSRNGPPRNDAARAIKEERQDISSVEAVAEMPRRPLRPLQAHRVHRGQHSPSRKVRLSMFLFCGTGE